jgi:ketosteroid isomerase-like protein
MSGRGDRTGSTGSFDVLRRVFDALGAADVAALDDLYTEDYVLELPYSKPEPVRVEGRAAAQAYLTGAFRTVRFALSITDLYEIEGGVVAEYTSEGEVVATGRRYANTYIGLWRIRDGRISATREFYDPLVAAEAFAEGA